ncbi:hypothetical protein [Hansschlegelia zhihuaiae]|uniref:PLL-like beta propeller domain-containing protein n=1 Tax=Hansschlegelia zhihuaiae TaxID=405005 RepID=A0A4Q0MKI6_9HYPH|nr:hypothetical protein [Hansschlegelia zhihuaiae]RXF74120.1 hypothetical protein EK403_07040 [Hansschlegelia zhihuaiae]
MASVPAPAFCGCCAGGAADRPDTILNRPGLSTLAYRIGTFGTFRRAMLERITEDARLSALTTRESDDYAISFLEQFAALADVLCFYNERIANEIFLRTARERDSVVKLVALLGYRPRPGLAATALLAFTLDDGARTRVRRGLPVMSMPAQDQRAQTYETTEPLVAHARLNAAAVHSPPTPFNAFARGSTGGVITARPEPLSIGDRLVVFGLEAIEEKTVAELRRQSDGVGLVFDPPMQALGLRPGLARAARIDRRLRFFGYNAPTKTNVFDTNPTTPPHERWKTVTVSAGLPGGLTAYPLDARYDDVKAGDHLLVDQGAGALKGPRLMTAAVTSTDDRMADPVGPLEDAVTHVSLRQTILGRPVPVPPEGGSPPGALRVAAMTGAGTLSLFARGGGSQTEAVWPGATTHLMEEPTVVGSGPHGLDLYYRNASGRLFAAFRGAGWTTADLGVDAATRPAAVDLPGAEALVAVTTPFGAARVLQVGAAGVLVDETVPAAATSPVAISSFDGTRVDVVLRGADRSVMHASRVGGVWSGFRSLAGVAAATPALVSPAPGRPEIFVAGDDGRLRSRRFDGTTWSDWLDLGGAVEGEVSAAALPGMVFLFARGRDGALWSIRRVGAVWGQWSRIGGTLTSDPSASTRDGVLRVFCRDGDGGASVASFSGTGWSAFQPMGFGLGEIFDRRTARIFRLSRPDVAFRGFAYPIPLQGGRLAVPLGDGREGLEEIAKDRRLILQAGAIRHIAQVTRRVEAAATPGDPPDHLLVDFAPPVGRLDGDVRMLGNVAAASHGESQPKGAGPDGSPALEPIGSGDATRTFQSFVLSKSPLTHLPSRKSVSGEPVIELRVNGELWRPVPSLYGRAPTDRVYALRQDDAGKTSVTFGDGRTGARLKSGALNVATRYRCGLGLEGRMTAGQLAIPLERPVGLRAVENPLPSDGGADPETRDDARLGAPASVKTFGRAVSLKDFEDVATASGLVARAFATWVWFDLQRVVHLTVAGADGAPLSAIALDDLHASLDSVRDPNRPLALSNLTRIPVVIRARLLRDPIFEVDDVLARARARILEAYAFEAQPLGAAVHASGVYAELQSVEGVSAVDVDLFHLKGYATLTGVEREVRSVTTDPVQPHIRVYPARPFPTDLSQLDRFALAGVPSGAAPPALAAEQAAILDPAEDVELSIAEAF